jgi:hypothetical protein
MPMHGALTMKNGEQLNGSITFLPAKGHSGPSATTKVEEGKYEFDRENGPSTGPHTVVVIRKVTRAASMKAIAAKQQTGENGQQWTLAADVKDDGQYKLDFTLDK